MPTAPANIWASAASPCRKSSCRETGYIASTSGSRTRSRAGRGSGSGAGVACTRGRAEGAAAGAAALARPGELGPDRAARQPHRVADLDLVGIDAGIGGEQGRQPAARPAGEREERVAARHPVDQGRAGARCGADGRLGAGGHGVGAGERSLPAPE